MPIEIDIKENALYKWGQEDGEVRGLSHGTVIGEAKALTKLLECRFGPLAEPIRARIASAGMDVLDRWIDRFEPATTLEDVFGD
jgi:hypothetical protein